MASIAMIQAKIILFLVVKKERILYSLPRKYEATFAINEKRIAYFQSIFPIILYNNASNKNANPSPT